MPNQAPLSPEQYAAMEPDKVLRIMQIIAGALIVGVLSFAGVASFVVFRMPQAAPPAARQNATDVLMYLGLAGAVLMVVASFSIPNLLANAMVKGIAKMAQSSTASGSKELFGRLLMAAQTRMIVALALIEGAAFFNLVAFIVTRSLIPPAVVAGLLAVMAIHFPTKIKLARWLEEQQRALS